MDSPRSTPSPPGATARSPRSWPAQKPRPAPVNTSTRASLFPTASSARETSSCICTVKELRRSGRLSVSRATPVPISSRMVSKSMTPPLAVAYDRSRRRSIHERCMNEADQLARRVADTLLAREGTGPAWGLVIEDAREGYARVRMALRDDMLNGHRSAHGGMIFALADSAFAYACNSRNETTVAQAATIAFLAPARAGDVLVAEARELSRSGKS